VLVPTLLPVLVAAAWGRSRATLRWIGPGRAWLAFVALGAPWFLYASLRIPGLLSYLLENQVWQRYTTHVHHRSGPPWYFLGALAAGSLPWLAPLVAGTGRAWRDRADERTRLLLAWLFAPLVFFSFSGSKLPSYLLPCFPAVGMLVALGVTHATRGVRLATAATLVLVAGALALLPRVLAHALANTARNVGIAHPATLATVPLPAIAWAGIAAMVVAAALALRGPFAPTALVVLAGWTGLAAGAWRYEGVIGSPRPIARVLAQNRSAGEPVVEYRRFNAGLPFYLDEPVHLLDVERELFFTPANERTRTIVTRDSIPALVAEHGRVWLLAPGTSARALADSLGLRWRRVSAWRQESLGFVEAAGDSR